MKVVWSPRAELRAREAVEYIAKDRPLAAAEWLEGLLERVAKLDQFERRGPLESLTAEERIALIGRLWDSLDPAAAAPLTPSLAVDLDRREAEADANPDAGIPWAVLRDKLRARIR